MQPSAGPTYDQDRTPGAQFHHKVTTQLSAKIPYASSKETGVRVGAEPKNWRDVAYVLIAATGMVALVYAAAITVIAESVYRYAIAGPIKRLTRPLDRLRLLTLTKFHQHQPRS